MSVILQFIGHIQFVIRDRALINSQKGTVRYYINEEDENQKQIVYDLKDDRSGYSVPRPMVSSKSGSTSNSHKRRMSQLMPGGHAKTQKGNKMLEQPKRYVDMIKRVIQKLNKLKLDKEASGSTKQETEYDRVVSNPALLVDFIDSGFKVDVPDFEHFEEKATVSEFEHHKLALLLQARESKSVKSKTFLNWKNVLQKYSKYYLSPELRHLSQLTEEQLQKQKMIFEAENINQIKHDLMGGMTQIQEMSADQVSPNLIFRSRLQIRMRRKSSRKG